MARRSAEPVFLLWLRFLICLVTPSMPMSRRDMLGEVGELYEIRGSFFWLNTKLNCLLMVSALLRLFVIYLTFSRRIIMPMFSRSFAFMNDQHRFVFRISPI